MRHARLHKILSGLTSLNVFDLGGRKLGMDDPDLGSWSYAYDALGNLTRQADARGQRVCLYYDALNRLSGKHYRLDDACPTSAPGSLDVAYLYDGYNPQSGQYGIGYRTGMVDDSGSTSWRYDTRGRVSQETKAITGSGSFTTQWTYNSADLLESLTYPGGSNNQAGETLIYDYHPHMALKSVYSSSGYYYVPGISYDAAGRVDVRKLGAASLGALPTLQVDYDYFDWGLVNGQGRLKRIQAGPPGNPAGLLDLRYFSETNTPAYDAVGNLLKIYDFKTGSPQTQTYMYDALDRLISASADGTTGNYSENYTYDLATGNLASKDGVNYSYDLNHPHAVTHLGGVQKYWYNANGNMTQRVTNVGTYSLGYDAENRLTEVSGAANATFVYDGDSRRVASTIGGTTAYIGDYFEWNSSTSSMKKYYYAGGTRIALREGNGGGTTGLLWLLGDHLGSTSVVATSSGGLQSKVLYKAWGEDRYISGTLPTGHRYTGQYKDNSINLSWYGSRWYDDSLGRFIQPDPIIPEPYNPLAYDRYQYVYSNPIRYTDNSGYCIDGISTWVCIGVVVGVISKVVDYGWTVYDAWKSGQILNDPNASQVEKDEAAANLAMAATF